MKKYVMLLVLIVILSCNTGCNVKDKAITILYQEESIDGVYTGEVKKGKPEGSGQFTSTSSDVIFSYDGTWKEGQPCQSGTLKTNQYSFEYLDKHLLGEYDGTTVDGLPDGQGKFESSGENKLIYDGEWKNGDFFGKGIVECDYYLMEYNEKKLLGTYNGEVLDGIANGQGDFTYIEDGNNFTYSGKWEKGNVKGKGYIKADKYVVHFSDVDREGVYEGDAVDGKPEGNGVFSALNADGVKYTYTGEWKNGLFDGQGVREFDDDNYYTHTGTFENGEFTPSIIEFIKSAGDIENDENVSYTITEKAETFIKNNTSLFPTKNADELTEFVDAELTYEMLNKNISKYGDSLVKMSKQNVISIDESEWWGKNRSTLILSDNTYSNIFYVYYNGELEEIYDNNWVTFYGLPVACSSYKNVGGGTTKCIVIYASYIEKTN